MSDPVKPAPKEDIKLWANYAKALKDQYLQDQELGPKNRIYIPAINTSAPLAGPGIPQTVTNYAIAKIGDSLVAPNNPFFTASGETYSRKCARYLENVQLDGKSEAGLQKNLEMKQKEAVKAHEAWEAMREKAVASKAKDPDATSQSLKEWVQYNYPAYVAADNMKQAASAALGNLMSQIYGPGYSGLLKSKADMGNVTKGEKNSLTMEVAPAELDEDSKIKAGTSTWAPKYTIDENYASWIVNQINISGDRNIQTRKLRIKSGGESEQNWASVGHDAYDGQASASFTPFFTASYNVNGKHNQEEVHVATSSSGVTVEFEFQDLRTFTISPDNSWNPGDIKGTYPNLYKGASPDLMNEMFIVKQIVVGYNVKMTIIVDKAAYEKINSSIDNAKNQDADASASFFGFKIKLQGHDKATDSTDFNKIVKSDDKYSFEIPASNDGVPVLLAVIAGSTLSK